MNECDRTTLFVNARLKTKGFEKKIKRRGGAAKIETAKIKTRGVLSVSRAHRV